jgi:outer membrane protein OmpA-like peptidoglycan-associated protein
MKYSLLKAIICFAVLAMMNSCGTTHKTGFELQKQIWESDKLNNLNDTTNPIYLTGAKPIDSIDVNKLIFDIFRVEDKDYPKEVRLFARVYDSSGNFVTNLASPYLKDTSKKYFTSIREELGKTYNIRKQTIDSFFVREFGADDSIAYNIVLSVDYSGSMDAIMEAIHYGTELFVSMKFPYDRVALTSFTKDYDIKVPLIKDTSDILKLYRQNKNRKSGMFSGIYDAVWKSYALLDSTPVDDPRVVVILTDGDDNYSKMNIDSVIKKANEKNIHVFAVAFGYSKDDNLKHLANYTGGRFYKPKSKEELVAIFKDIYLSLRYHYRISYKPPVYWGFHNAFAGLNIPHRADSLIANGFYDTTGWLALSDTVIRPIFFDFDSSVIKKESFQTLDELVDLMYTWPKLKFDIHGHTDNKGTQEYNQILSDKRAKAVYDALISRGVDERRLRFRGFGFSKPIASNETEEGRAKNRRTEFIIIAK